MSNKNVINASLDKIRRRYKLCILIFAISLLVFLVLLGAYVKAYDGKVLLNSDFYGENVAGLSRDEMLTKLKDLEDSNRESDMKLIYQEASYNKNFQDLGWDLNEEKTADSIMSYGHSGNYWSDWLDHLRSVFVKKRFIINYEVNHQAVDDWTRTIEQEIATPKKEANVIVRGDDVEVIDPEAGTKVNMGYLGSRIDERFALKNNDDIKVELIEEQPKISREQAQSLSESALEKTSSSIKIFGPKGSVELSSYVLGRSLQVRLNEGQVYLSLDNNKIKAFLEDSMDNLNNEAQDASFSISGGNVILRSASEPGEVIKIEDSVNEIVKAFEDGKDQVELPYEKQEPSISAQNIADIQRYGIKEIVGEATTDFSGSPANRLHNIKNGVKFISGTLIKPGEEFSTIGTLGEIDQSTGYLPELVIKDDETIPEFGGGLCQVSTTLFRAAMNAGLKITERQNHSYRVSYYEPPVGMDATIYSPKPDFKFINTTDNYILIYGYVEGYKITFEMYGTSDGRRVQISDPEVYDITTPSETIYIEDPSMAPGEEKRLERAHNGAKARFYYKVYKNGGLIEDETFLSYYVAWPAKYLRGPEKQEDEGGDQQAQESPVPEESQQ